VILNMTSAPHSVLRQVLEMAVIVCLLADCTNAPPPTPLQTAWPEYRGDAARDGHPSGVSLRPDGAAKLAQAWSVRLDGAVDGTPAVANGRVVVGTAGGTLAALGADSGAAVWTEHDLGAISSSPTIAGDRVFVTTLTGRAYAFGLERGNLIWEWIAPPGSALWASPVAFRDEVIIGVASPYGDTPLVAGRLYALDSANGTVRWTECVRAGCQPGGGVWSTAAIDSRGVGFVGTGNPDDGVLAFDPMTGQRRWFASPYLDLGRDLDLGSSPVVFSLDGKEAVAQASAAGLFFALDAGTGGMLWSRPLVTGSAVHGLLATPAYDGTAFFVASASPPTGVLALNPRDGAVRWRHSTDLPVYSAPAAGNGVLIFGTGAVFGDLESGSLLALSTRDGQVLWSYDMHSAVRSGPALAGDLVVVGDYAGDVLAFRPRA
jgi:polyvinyl alcohol dehydrogenase (cytochrome)